MPFFNRYNVGNLLEHDMESDIIDFIKHTQFYDNKGYELNDVKIYRQVGDSSIGRISDIIVKKGKQLINIECKLNDVGGVYSQAIDHLTWADYSYIAMPYRTYISSDWNKKMIAAGIGLFLWHDLHKVLIEAIYAKYHPKVNNLRKFQGELKKTKLNILAKFDQFQKKQAEKAKQQVINFT